MKRLLSLKVTTNYRTLLSTNNNNTSTNTNTNTNINNNNNNSNNYSTSTCSLSRLNNGGYANINNYSLKQQLQRQEQKQQYQFSNSSSSSRSSNNCRLISPQQSTLIYKLITTSSSRLFNSLQQQQYHISRSISFSSKLFKQSSFSERYKPPTHKKQEYVYRDTNGNQWIDNYEYFRNLDCGDVQQSIDCENHYVEQYRNHKLTDRDTPNLTQKQDRYRSISELADILREENESTTIEAPESYKDFEEEIDGFQYLTDERGVYYRRQCSSNSSSSSNDRQVKQILFKNGMDNGYKLTTNDIVSFKFAEDNSTYLYVADVGQEKYHCFVRRVEQSSSTLQFNSKSLDHIENIISAEWALNNDIYYTIPNELNRPYRIYKRQIGSNQPDELIYEELDDQYFLDVVKSKDGKYLFFCSNSKSSTCVFYIDLYDKNSKPKICLKRTDNLEYYVEHNNDQFIIFANFDKKDLSIYIAPDTIENGSIDDIKELLPTIDNLSIRDVDVFQDKLVLCELYNSSPRIRVISKNPLTNQFDPNHSKSIQFPEVSSIQLGINQGKNKKHIRVLASSPLVPNTSFDIDLYDDTMTKYPSPTITGPLSLNKDDFICEKVFVESTKTNGVKIPMSLQYCFRNPILIKGYGAYGTVMDTGYDQEDLALLKRGWVVATAHVRGGGELGRNWYESGKKMNKKNSIYDFVDCLEYLIASGFTSARYLVAHGSSAGGVLMGNMALAYPQYFGAIVAKVPFVDMISAMLDESLPLTTHEFGEWGNPSDPDVFNYISSYDPYRIVPSELAIQTAAKMSDSDRDDKLKTLPSMLVTCSLQDIRVPYWQPLKWVAKLRESISNGSNNNSNNNNNNNNQKQQENVLLLKVEDHGHFGSKIRSDYMDDLSFEQAFIINSIDRIK
ncbi:oligopeptidase B [Heterostelium album PN500]|uniref:Prolyl endopeptidase n=1 Tax=Heterostelium pallidum (strain ATCC 26659 / Pp 5 / PN500) TaxID=670386 RepID=D3BSR4_HETP5|nr:oligopeptidase B [Heterostelium album PN500]EFA75529.1 oligopeptidase B [Heterostelium album PN500]|eukprot:XP_020427663.1 oligopeptidase B [Heterostelium album PN500]